MLTNSKIPAQVLAFAGAQEDSSKLAPYKMFVDYWNHYMSRNGKEGLEYSTTTVNENDEVVSISFDEKEFAMNNALKKEIMRHAGIASFDQFPLETWANHPTLKWATFAVVSALVDMILPQVIIDSIGLYSDIRTIGFGDSAAFDVEPRDLFVVSKAGRAKRTSEINKQFKGQVVINPEQRELTVGVALYRVLAGKESLAEFVMKVARSMEAQLTLDAYNAFVIATAALSTGAAGLKVAGYTQTDFVTLSQKVQAWNGGQKVICVGTQLALANIIPADANYRYEIDSDFVKLGYVRNFAGTDIMVMPQVADFTTPFQTLISNSYLWFISPGAQKLLKVVLEGNTLSYTSDVYANANLLQTSTMYKSWGVGVATNAVAGCMTV
jgi:hypothetical protein